MSSLSSALAAALQNDSTVSALVTGIIPGRNFSLQDSMLSVSPFACISVIDLIQHERAFIGGSWGIPDGQIEIRCISKSSEHAVKTLADAVKTFIRANTSLPWNGSTIYFAITMWLQNPLTSEDLTTWEEILTLDYLG